MTLSELLGLLGEHSPIKIDAFSDAFGVFLQYASEKDRFKLPEPGLAAWRAAIAQNERAREESCLQG